MLNRDQVKERPILFNGAMVRAILEGRKTMTRRIVKPAPQMVTDHKVELWNGDPAALMRLLEASGRSPFGKPGDRLWVRETWRGVVQINAPHEPYATGVARYVPDIDHCVRIEYAATQAADSEPWRPSIRMPRWASRIDLEVTGVRVERLNEISADDARGEGCPDRPVDGAEQASIDMLAKLWFHDLWESINGAESWSANPWVWVVEFKRVEAAR